MAITHVQSRASTAFTVDQSLAYSSNVTAGNLLLCVVRESAAQTADPVVTDTQGNTWAKTREQASGGGGSTLTLFWTKAGSTGANTVSVNSDNATATRMTLHEFAGSFPADPNSANDGNSAAGSAASPYSTPSLNPSGAALVFACIGTQSDVTFSSAGTGFTLGPVATAATGRLTSGYNIVTGSGSVNAAFAWTGTSNGAGSIIASFVENPGPTITVEPTAQTARINGDTTNTATFSVTATGTGTVDITTQIESGVGTGVFGTLANGSGATWSGLTGTGSGSASVTAVGTFTAKTLSGRKVRLAAEDDNGTTYSNEVVLTVFDGPVLSAASATTNGSGVASVTMTSDDALSANGEILLITARIGAEVIARTTVRPG